MTAQRIGPGAVLAIAATALGVVAGPAIATTGTSDVLLLYSNGRFIPANIEGDPALHQTLRANTDRPTTLFYEFLDAPAFGGPAFERITSAYLRDKYAARPPRVLVAISEEALRFLLRYRAELFPHAPLVHVGVDRSVVRSLGPLPDDVIGIPVQYDSSPTMELALRLHPRARRLVIVTGASRPDRGLEARARREASPFSNRVTVEFLAGLPMRDVLRRLGELGQDSVVLTPGTFRDGEGHEFTPKQSVIAIAAASTAPVYGPYSTLMGTGIVGGYMPSFEAMARQAGHIVNELLGGAEPGSLQVPDVIPQTLHLDWRQLRRWHIDEKLIPDDAVVHFEPQPLLEAYHDQVIAAVAVFVLQAALIGWLFAERRRRRTAELVEETQRRELAHASRLAIAGELTGAIAHEINQPLGAILSNADAAELILDAGGDHSDELRRIFADIRSDNLRASEVIRRLRSLLTKHEIEHRVFDLNEAVRDAQSVLDAEALRRHVALHIRPAQGPLIVVGDPIQMQQVVINLVLNAMDAVAGLPETRRLVEVSVDGTDSGTAVTVSDHGRGISPEILPKLFDPFVTTKSDGMGLGLAIARTLVEAHGGRLWAENGGRQGAVFRVELPTARVSDASWRGPS